MKTLTLSVFTGNQSAVSTVISRHRMIEQSVSSVLKTYRESAGTFLKDPRGSKPSISNIGKIVLCDTFNAWYAVIYIT